MVVLTCGLVTGVLGWGVWGVDCGLGAAGVGATMSGFTGGGSLTLGAEGVFTTGGIGAGVVVEAMGAALGS